jgi:hypothetical protein
MVMSDMKKPRDGFVLARATIGTRPRRSRRAYRRCCRPCRRARRSNRLTLAKWLVQPDHPLTSRVAVNRFWQMYFGHGIVKTQEDFGVQGEPPVHPELLDWLATEFIRTGWDIRAMQRLIVTSATYRQSSKMTATLLEKDPENRLLARGPRGRLPAEMIRDTTLAAAACSTADRRTERVSYQQGIVEEMARRRPRLRRTSRATEGLARRGCTFGKRTARGVARDVRRAGPRSAAPDDDQHAAQGAGAAQRPDLRRSLARDGAAIRQAARTWTVSWHLPLATARKPTGKGEGAAGLLGERLTSFNAIARRDPALR